MSKVTSHLTVPHDLDETIKFLREEHPSLLKRLSFHDIDVITRKIRQRFADYRNENPRT